jgi:hypothetical protein
VSLHQHVTINKCGHQARIKKIQLCALTIAGNERSRCKNCPQGLGSAVAVDPYTVRYTVQMRQRRTSLLNPRLAVKHPNLCVRNS